MKKCSSCGGTTKADVPFCSKCGALFPVHDEREIMRQTMGASFEWKWVITGALVAAVLQFALLAVFWNVWGNKILVGEKGRSIMDVNLEGVNPDWGRDVGGNRVVLKIKPDNDEVNTAQKVVAVLFGGIKAKPFHKEHMARFSKECFTNCDNQKTATRNYNKCMQGCGKEELGKEKKEVDTCLKPCMEAEKKAKAAIAEEKDEKKKEKLKKELKKELKKLKCGACDKKYDAFIALRNRCTDDCPKKKTVMDTEAKRCSECKKKLVVLTQRSRACEKKTTACWSFTDTVLPAKPDLTRHKTDKARRDALAEWKKALKARKKLRSTELKTKIYAYTPRNPGKNEWTPVKIVFSSGEELVRRQGFHYVPAKQDSRPKTEKTKRKLHDPVSTVGFWLLLMLSALFYFAGGFVVGRLSPSVSIKEPFSTGLFGWISFIVALVVIGAASSAIMFSAFIGAPAFIGFAVFGGWVAEKLHGFA